MIGKSIMKRATLLCTALLLGTITTGCSQRSNKVTPTSTSSTSLPQNYTQASNQQIKHTNLKQQVNTYALYSPSFNRIANQSIFKDSKVLHKQIPSDWNPDDNGYDWTSISLQNPTINSASKISSRLHLKASLKGSRNYAPIIYINKRTRGFESIIDKVTPKTVTFINGTNLARIHSIKYKLISVENGSNRRKELILKPVKIIPNHLSNKKLTRQIITYDNIHPLTLQENAKINHK